MTYFYTKYLGLDERLASIVWMIFAAWNALNDAVWLYFRPDEIETGAEDSLYPLWRAAVWTDFYPKLVFVAFWRQPGGTFCADAAVTFLF